MNGEARRSREAVRNSIRTYGVKVMDPASMPLKKTRETESQESVSRFSEKSLHSQYEIREGSCKECLYRIPYATLFATVLCFLGILIALLCDGRTMTLTKAVIHDVFRESSSQFENISPVLLIFDILTIILAIMILVVGFLATGDTRSEIYKGWKARLGGRICCLVLIIFSFIGFFVWFGVLLLFSAAFILLIVYNDECTTFTNSIDKRSCLPVPFSKIFTNRENVEICDGQEIKKFCKDFVEKAVLSVAGVNFGYAVIVISVVIFIACLAANYARIRCQAKFQELQELQHLDGNLRNTRRF